MHDYRDKRTIHIFLYDSGFQFLLDPKTDTECQQKFPRELGFLTTDEWIHVHVWLSPFAAHLKLSQHCLLISYTPIQNKKFKKIITYTTTTTTK